MIINKMRIKFIILVFLIFCFGCNKLEKSINLNQIRIISLSPHITEIIYKLEIDSDLIAVTDYCKYPLQAQNKESIGGLLNPNIEKIVSLKPTHLFGVPSHSKLNQQLSQFGLAILMMPNETLQDIQNSISSISDTLKIADKGKQLNESINQNIIKLKNNAIKRTKINAMLSIGREMGSVKNITVAGPNTYLNEIWELMGGINIFNDINAKYSTVNLEEIIKRNPDIIIELKMNAREGINNIVPGSEWKYLYNVNAVSQSGIYEIGGNYSLIPGPRVVKLAQNFFEILNSANKK